MNSAIKEVGSMLRSKRKEMNLSLKEVENTTSIRAGFLEAIEEGTIMKSIAGVYALGFIKQYASFLGVDVEGLIRKNPQLFRLPAEKLDFSYGIGTLEVRGGSGGGVRWLPNTLIILGVGILLFLMWLFGKYMDVF